jgi:tetratricopeptide (TPR) repeat protein
VASGHITNWRELRLRTMSPMQFEQLCVRLMGTVDEYKGVDRCPLGHGDRDQGIDARVDHPSGEMRVWFCFSTRQDWWRKCRDDIRKYDDSVMKQVEEVVFCCNVDVDKHEVDRRRRDAESIVRKLARRGRIRVRIFTMRELLGLLRRKKAQKIVEEWALGFMTADGTLIWEPMERLRSSIELLDRLALSTRREVASEVYQTHFGLLTPLRDVARECQRKNLGLTGEQRLCVILNNLACLCVNRGDRQSAYEHLILALDLLAPGPERACVLSNLVKICSEMNERRAEAVHHFRELRRLFGSFEELRLPRGVPLLQLGWATEIGDPSQGFWTPSDRVVVPFRYAGYAYVYVGRIQEARALFERSVEWQGRQNCSPDSLLGLAHIHRLVGEHKDCRQLVDEALGRLREQAGLGRDGGSIQYEACAATYAGQYDEALRYVERLKEVEPERLHYIRDEPHYEPLRQHFGHEFQEVAGE